MHAMNIYAFIPGGVNRKIRNKALGCRLTPQGCSRVAHGARPGDQRHGSCCSGRGRPLPWKFVFSEVLSRRRRRDLLTLNTPGPTTGIDLDPRPPAVGRASCAVGGEPFRILHTTRCILFTGRNLESLPGLSFALLRSIFVGGCCVGQLRRRYPVGASPLFI